MEKTGLIKLSAAREALAQVQTIEDALPLRDMSETARAHAKKIGLTLNVQNDIAEYKLDCERVLGKMLKEMVLQKERAGKGQPKKETSHHATLKDLGIKKDQSSRWQQIAKVPEDVYKEHVTETKAAGNELTTASVLKIAQKEKKKDQIDKLKEIESIPNNDFGGLYDVVVIDPPWQIKKIDRDCRPNQVEFDYPTMTIEEIISEKPPMAKNCNLWLWTTHKFLPLAFDILKAWELKYVCTFVWHKPGGFQPVGLPQYNCEFALYARRGTPVFTETKNLNVCFEAPRTGHSAKPGEFYDMVSRVTSGKRLDMYNRREIDGFDGWGKES